MQCFLRKGRGIKVSADWRSLLNVFPFFLFAVDLKYTWHRVLGRPTVGADARDSNIIEMTTKTKKTRNKLEE